MGGRFNCVGAWSCLRRAGLPRSLLSPPGEAFWPSGPMDHGVQRRERGGGQAAGPAAGPELAAPSAAAVPREIPTCSASLLFRLSGPQAAGCHRQFLCSSSDAFSARPVRGYAAAGLTLFPALPAVRRHNHHGGHAQPFHSAQPVVRRLRCSQHSPRQRTVMAQAARHACDVRLSCSVFVAYDCLAVGAGQGAEQLLGDVAG